MDERKSQSIKNKIYIERVTCQIYLDAIQNAQLYTKEIKEAAIIWYDGIFRSEKYKYLSRSKYLNKIPGMTEICNKYNLFQILKNQIVNGNYDEKYIPKTYLIADKQDIEKFKKEQKSKTATWIMKPGSKYGGNGIEIFQGNNPTFLKESVIQEYIKPFKIAGHKFDLRLHLLITCLDPFTLYINKEGIARFCSEEYSEPNPQNLQNKFQHLTNSCLNCKNSTDFPIIRKLSEVSKEIGDESLWDKIKETSKNTIFALKEEILNKINEWESSENDVHDDKIPLKERFFHLLGIDILISEDKKPYVLELNDNPAIKNFNEVDLPIKEETVKSEIQLIRSLFIEKNSEFDDPQWEKLEKASKNQENANKNQEKINKSQENTNRNQENSNENHEYMKTNKSGC